MRYSDIENINLGHRQISFGFENNLSQEQNAVMECLADQIKQHGHVVLSEFVPYVKGTHSLSEFKILQYIFWIAQDFKIQFRINNKNLDPFKVKNLLLNSIELSEQLLIIAKVRAFNDMIVKEKTDQCRIDAFSEFDQMVEKMKSLLDAHSAGMDLRNKALYSLRQIKTRVEKAESVNAVNLCLNDAEYIFDVLLENGTLPSRLKPGDVP